jgi:peptidoglycan lytic transglycosylase G
MRRALWIFSLGLILLAGWVARSLWVPYRSFPVSGVYVDVPHGASRRAIAAILADQGVVRNRWVFEALCRWRPRRTLEAGEYFFDHPVTAFDVFDTLANGRVFVRELVVPEGYSMFDIADLLQRQGFMSRQEFLAAARDPAPIRDLAPDAPTLEGFLFPATYKFPRHPSGEEAVIAMTSRFREEWAKLSSGQPDPPGLSVEQVVILASLVERETPKAEERPLVAGVFMNRLRRHLPLQCDPTVVYALELAGRFSGRLEASDLPFASPYNTYRHVGLPPGPIANPGAGSLRAALAPADTPYLYFVANTEGGHFFGKTLAEHDRNVARYLKLLAGERSAAHSSGAQRPAGNGSAAPRSP